ncbi:Hypothetical predicted protein [Lecanosticta acicola]|uniref:Uncharacterized protein n=1 Tax=Lecanosticta acicola TaxID=111012 RepID=A0AAI8Z7S9_9PEZI|nr:Hypothetical predicted protein [Lecanosticta acicola]
MAIKPVFFFEPASTTHHGPGDPTEPSAAGKDIPPPSMPQPHSSDPSPTRTAVPDEEPRPVKPLADITRQLRLQRYQKRRCYQAEENLHYLQIATARTSRLARAARSVQHTLAECIKTEDKASFANLLHAFRDACDDCLRPSAESEAGNIAEPRPTTSFLENLPSSSRASILDFLAHIRYDGAFVANRLKCLTHKELIALLPDRSLPRSNDSIFGGFSRSTSRTSKPLGFVVDAQSDLLSSHAYSSTLEALVFSTNGLSKAGAYELDRATNIWATVSASLISEQKPGSERLVPAVLDIWTTLAPWPGKDRLQVWILQTLQQGSFLLEQPSKQTFRARVEGRSDVSPEEEVRTERFYNQAADSLLELFGVDSGPSVIPPGALRMCRAIWVHLRESPGHQRALPQFLITRWLFSAFVMDTVTLPEAYGMLTDHYVSDVSRQRILREVVTRAQRCVFDVAYAWKYASNIPSDTTHRVHTLMSRFSSLSSITSSPPQSREQLNRQETFLALSAKDVSTCLNALYPQRRPASVSSDGDNLKSGLQSSASSISGFSLFQNAHVPDPTASISTLSPLDFQGLHLAGTPQPESEVEAQDQQVQDGFVREACLELDDFVSSQTTNSKDLWGVFYAPAESDTLCTANEKYADACYPEAPRRSHNGASAAMTIRTSRREKSSLMKALESLLYDLGVGDSPEDSGEFAKETEDLGQVQEQVESLFELAIQDCEARSEFVRAHDWFLHLQDFRSQVQQSTNRAALRNMLLDIEAAAQRSKNRALVLQGAYDRWTRMMSTRLQLQSLQLNPLVEEHERLRDKMWYVADVRTSAAYDEARSISSALCVMGKAKRPSRTRMAPPLRNWSTLKMTNTNLHLKTEAQILEILSARPDHGGPNKLSDDQSRATELWMDRQDIDNLCRGEERLHKLCMEVRKCVETVTATPPAENTAIWSNTLFARDVALKSADSPTKPPTLLSTLHGGAAQSHFLSLHGHPRSNDALSSTSQTLSSISSRDYLDSTSPTLNKCSSMPFWSPATTEVDSPSSATSVNSSMMPSAFERSTPKQHADTSFVASGAIERLRQRTTSLVLSDLTSILFSDGSETDRAYWSGLGWQLTDRHFRSLDAFRASIDSQTPTAESSLPVHPPLATFGFESAFATLLRKFSLMSNPSTKLSCLHDMDRLLVPYMAEQGKNHSLMSSYARPSSGHGQLMRSRTQDASETSVNGFRHIFSKSSLRPKTVFRDLQYIAALLPAAVLQNTPEGKAFCNAAVAISSLKHEARGIMVETADSIIAYHSNNRGHGRSSSMAQQERDSATFTAPSRTPSAEDYSRYSMADAAYLLQITAKEGDPVAQRELATLYLTNPELMDRVVAPFARTREIFKDELESKWRKNQDPNRFDYYNLCVVLHWMSLSSKGGDFLAREYLKQQEQMDSF